VGPNRPAQPGVRARLSIFKDGWGRIRTTSRSAASCSTKSTEYKARLRRRRQRGPATLLHVLRNGAPSEVLLFSVAGRFVRRACRTVRRLQSPIPWAARNSKLTLQPRAARAFRSLPARFFSRRRFGPAERARFKHQPAGGRFAAVDNLLTWNLSGAAPWLHLRLARQTGPYGPQGQTTRSTGGIPATAVIAENLNNNPVDWYNRYSWADKNGNGVWDQGRARANLSASRGRRRQRDPSIPPA